LEEVKVSKLELYVTTFFTHINTLLQPEIMGVGLGYDDHDTLMSVVRFRLGLPSLQLTSHPNLGVDALGALEPGASAAASFVVGREQSDRWLEETFNVYSKIADVVASRIKGVATVRLYFTRRGLEDVYPYGSPPVGPLGSGEAEVTVVADSGWLVDRVLGRRADDNGLAVALTAIPRGEREAVFVYRKPDGSIMVSWPGSRVGVTLVHDKGLLGFSSFNRIVKRHVDLVLDAIYTMLVKEWSPVVLAWYRIPFNISARNVEQLVRNIEGRVAGNVYM